MFVFLRIAIGLVFLFSSLGKLFSPYQNFLYIIQAYQILPSWAETSVAMVFPWIEFLVGFFVFIGFWTPWALRGALVLFGIFIVVVGQALIRGLPLENCGCFGELIHIKPPIVMVLDSFSLLLSFALLRNLSKTNKISLDIFFK